MQKWKIIELMGYAYYSQQGYRILVSLVENAGYDFVAEKDGEFIRINVKMAGLKDKKQCNSWSVSLASGSSNKIKEDQPVDTYLVWLPNKNTFIELPGDFFAKSNSKSKRIPKEFLI